MEIKDPNHIYYDGISCEEYKTDVFTILDDAELNNFAFWRKKNPKAEIINMNISVVGVKKMEKLDGTTIYFPMNAITMQVKAEFDENGDGLITEPTGDIEWEGMCD